jgi:hypothetical protein
MAKGRNPYRPGTASYARFREAALKRKSALAQATAARSKAPETGRRAKRRAAAAQRGLRAIEAREEFRSKLNEPGAMRRVLEERLIPLVPVTVRVFIGCRPALARGKPWLAGKWEDVTRHESFEWQTKRDAMRIKISDEGYLVTFPPALSILAESEGYEPADFDRRIEISGESGSTVEIDENMLLEAMPDFIPFLPRE